MGEVARPCALVLTVFTPPANVPLAPVCEGGVNVTLAFGTGFPRLSATSATNGLLNDVLMVALWLDPLTTVMEAGVPAVFVREKLAGVPTPPTVAATV